MCYYMVDRCRGSPALQKFFLKAFAGTLVHDFWAAYAMFEGDGGGRRQARGRSTMLPAVDA